MPSSAQFVIDCYTPECTAAVRVDVPWPQPTAGRSQPSTRAAAQAAAVGWQTVYARARKAGWQTGRPLVDPCFCPAHVVELAP